MIKSTKSQLMITLKQALALKPEELDEIKDEIRKKVAQSNLNAYVGEILESSSGVPILIKDNINVKDWEITCASEMLKGYVSPYHATVIENLHKNGMCGFGRSNMDEFAMGSTSESSCYGITKNPLDESCVPGGSSGGSAAAVGGGLAIAALGSDTGGSIRQPAAFCGCVGLKPTYGSVSRYGLVAYSSSLDQIGPITQNVEDCAILFDAIRGHDPKDSTSKKTQPSKIAPSLKTDDKKRFKIATLKGYADGASSEVQSAYYDMIKELEKMGHTIVEREMLSPSVQIAIYYVISTAEASSNLARFDGVRYGMRVESESLKEMYLESRSQGFGAEVKRRIMLGSFVLSSASYDAYYLRAQKIRALIGQSYENILKECDLIFTPITPTLPPKIGALNNALDMYLSDIYTVGANLSGLPAISLPIGKSGSMPIGGQFIGHAFDERSLFEISLEVERALKI